MMVFLFVTVRWCAPVETLAHFDEELFIFVGRLAVQLVEEVMEIGGGEVFLHIHLADATGVFLEDGSSEAVEGWELLQSCPSEGLLIIFRMGGSQRRFQRVTPTEDVEIGCPSRPAQARRSKVRPHAA